MKFCTNCGAPLKEDQKVCTQCGTPVNPEPVVEQTQEPVRPAAEKTTATEPIVTVNKAPREPMSKGLKWGLIGLAALLLLLFAGYSIAKSQFSPEKQAARIADAMNNKDADKLAGLVTSNSKKISATEAKAFIDYVYENDNVSSFAEQIKSTTADMKSLGSESSPLVVNSDEVMKISKDGKAMGLFEKYQYDIPTRSVLLSPRDSGTLSFKMNGKDQSVDLTGGSEKKLGEFVLGNYSLDAKKEVNGEKYDGKLNIDMSNGSYATEAFNYGYIDFDISNYINLDSSEITFFVNDKPIKDFSDEDSMISGPLPTDKKLSIHAELKSDGETFKSDTQDVTLTADNNEDPQPVSLTFDDKEIAKHVDKKEEEAQAKAETASVDIFSEDFYDGYMKTNYLSGYRGINIGMSRDKVENIIGEPEDEYVAGNIEKYGNIGVDYGGTDGKKVKQIYIIPDYEGYLTKDEAEEEYAGGNFKYSEKVKDGTAYYIDGNRGNGFVIVVVADNDDNVLYMYQREEKASDPWVQ